VPLMIWALAAVFGLIPAVWIGSRLGGVREVRFESNRVWLPAAGHRLTGRYAYYDEITGLTRYTYANRKLRVTTSAGQRRYHSSFVDIDKMEAELRRRTNLEAVGD
jgi:hypothetical protein